MSSRVYLLLALAAASAQASQLNDLISYPILPETELTVYPENVGPLATPRATIPEISNLIAYDPSIPNEPTEGGHFEPQRRIITPQLVDLTYEPTEPQELISTTPRAISPQLEELTYVPDTEPKRRLITPQLTELTYEPPSEPQLISTTPRAAAPQFQGSSSEELSIANLLPPSVATPRAVSAGVGAGLNTGDLENLIAYPPTVAEPIAEPILTTPRAVSAGVGAGLNTGDLENLIAYPPTVSDPIAEPILTTPRALPNLPNGNTEAPYSMVMYQADAPEPRARVALPNSGTEAPYSMVMYQADAPEPRKRIVARAFRA